MVTVTETCYVIVRNEGFHHARAPVRPCARSHAQPTWVPVLSR
jgi:hypothetical protein